MSLPEKDPVLTLMQRRDTFEAFVPSSLYVSKVNDAEASAKRTL